MRFVLMLAFILCPAVARAASFDCAKARSPLEHAICGNADLSAADDALAKAYAEALKKLDASGADALKQAQRQWLRDLPDLLKREGVAAVQAAYEDRTGALQAVPGFPAPDEPVEGDTFRYQNAPAGYDLTLRFLQPCDETAYDCAGPGQLVLRAAGKPDVLQVINIPAVLRVCSLDEAADLTQLCGSQPLVDIEDYNFDGTPDIAVTNDQEGGYGSYGRTVFLFDPATRRFVYNPEISALTNTLTVDLDQAKKRIVTGMKSGVGYHEDTTYRVENNKPVPESRHIEDGQIDNPKDQRTKITDSTWVAGKWVDKVHYEKW